jgi:hypothetical protein
MDTRTEYARDAEKQAQAGAFILFMLACDVAAVALIVYSLWGLVEVLR